MRAAREQETVAVTPEMIEAGLAVLWESGAVAHPLSIDRDLVRKIFLAMCRVRETESLRYDA
jgi:hypothetical protein